MKIILTFFLLVSSALSFGADHHVKGRETLLKLLTGEWVAKSLHVVNQLSIPKYLHSGPKKIEELAKLVQCDEDNLYRIMRMLASEEVFFEAPGRVFSNGPLGELLAENDVHTLHSLTQWYSQEIHQSWEHLHDCLKTGRPAFELTFGEPVFPYFQKHPKSGALFASAMMEKSRAVIEESLEAYDFDQFRYIYDIGGGKGLFLTTILKQHPQIKGTLFELKSIIEEAKALYQEAYDSRLILIAGDFFQEVPAGGDCYILKSILHDWSDDKAIAILKKCRSAMSPNAKLLIIENLLLPQPHDFAKVMDILMMVITGGKERTLEEMIHLLEKGGFHLDKVIPTSTEFCLIEARPT